MTQRAPETIQAPHHQGVAGAQMVEQPGELDALVQRATGRVVEDPRASGSGQRVVLEGELLLPGRDPRIPSSTAIQPNVSQDGPGSQSRQ